jgi:hypothetical protein
MGIQFKSETEIAAVVEGLESCTTAKDAFPHHKHLAVASWYLRERTAEEALQKMRSSLLCFLQYHNIDCGKYKEELTRAWIKLVQSELASLDPNLSFVARTNLVIEHLNDPELVFARFPENLQLQAEKK